MIKKLLQSILLSFMAMILFSGVAYAAWEYLFPTTIVDTSNTTRTYLSVFLGYGGQSLVDAAKINSDGLDTNMQIGSTNIKYMMATGNVTAVIPSLPSGGVVTTSLYTGYSPEQTVFAIITGSGGYVTVSDNASLELGDNFSTSVSGYFNTDNGTEKHLIDKGAAFNIAVSPTVSSNITLSIFGDDSFVSPTSDGGGSWTNKPYAYDNNEATRADFTVAAGTWSDNLTLNIASTTMGSIQLYPNAGAGITTANVSLYYEGAWNTVYSATPSYSGNNTIYLPENHDVTSATLNFYNPTGGPVIAYVVEFKFGTPSATISATGVVSGEHTIRTQADSPYWKLGVDATTEEMSLPPTDNLTMNAPLWQIESNSDPFSSIDDNAFSIDVETAIWSSDGYVFDGTDDQLDLADNVTFDFTDNQTGTYIVWFKTTNLQDQFILNKGNIDNAVQAGNEGWTLRIDQPRLEIELQDIDNDINIENATTIVVNTWTMATMVIDGINNQARVYHNTASSSNLDISSIGDISNSLELAISGYSNNPGYGEFIGTIGEVAKYDIAFNNTQVAQYYNATKGKYTGGDVLNYSIATSIPDTSANWTFFENNVMPYTDNITISVGGTQQLYLAPNAMISGTNIPDRSGNSHNGTITWGSNSGISLTYGEMSSFESFMATSNITGGFSVPSASMPSTWFAAGENVANLPFYDSFSEVAAQTGVPVQTLYSYGIIGLAFGVFIGLVSFTRSALMAYIAMVMVFAFGSSMTIIPAWIVFVMIIVGVGIIYLYKQVAY